MRLSSSHKISSIIVVPPPDLSQRHWQGWSCCSGAVELRNAVTSSFGVDLPATVTFDQPSVAALATYIASRLKPAQAGADIQQSSVPNLVTESFTRSQMTEVIGISNSVSTSGREDRGTASSLHSFRNGFPIAAASR